jgi:Fuc2NAc and GlcNAc transferase
VILLAIGAAAAAATALLTGYVLARHAVMDVPNERSSHSVPTPRGGGLAIVAVVLAAVGVLGGAGALAAGPALALGGGALVALVGWLDDRHRLPVGVRLLAHLLAGAWALAWLGALPVVRLGGAELRPGALGAVVALLGIVWAINFFNFMDGIDGIAAVRATAAGAGAAVILAAAGAPGLAAACAALAGAAAGFLGWNWHPARIFMGDVGSATLGYLLAVLGIASERAVALPLLGFVVLLGPFVVDSTVTLLRRLARGERVHQAHRGHAYQRLVLAGWSHAAAAGVYGAAAALMAVPAWLLWSRPAAGAWAAAAALLLLLAGYAAVERLHPLPKGG